ncbi:MAG: type 1 glutamine amidotransferase-like domain-containing protein [Candidatus Aenigmarchaeota archaeon]|nr:type 1 glutamine amidotransferase-like domain-containing protein [Candidatus Aenigmarchaeota archaeon]
MKKLLLTSEGLSNQNIRNEFLDLLEKPASETRIVIITTGSRTEEELKYVEESKEELIETGIKRENIKTLDLKHKIIYGDVERFDAIYFCGGNTFFILHKVRENGFDKVIERFVNEGKLYIGVSAGSIIMSPSIVTSSDENNIGIKDLTGLKLVDVLIVPHYNEDKKSIIEEYRKKLSYEIVSLTDNQALVVKNGKMEIVE